LENEQLLSVNNATKVKGEQAIIKGKLRQQPL
jgi:hypothetical protein